jgi:hypothetical protein
MMDTPRRFYGSSEPPRETTAVNTAEALVEIERAIRGAFPSASNATACAHPPGVTVKFEQGAKPVSVQFSQEALNAYRRGDEALRQRALTTLQFVCNFAFAREYAATQDATNAFIIDAEMALLNTRV